jgi:hypothetical protein
MENFGGDDTVRLLAAPLNSTLIPEMYGRNFKPKFFTDITMLGKLFSVKISVRNTTVFSRPIVQSSHKITGASK